MGISVSVRAQKYAVGIRGDVNDSDGKSYHTCTVPAVSRGSYLADDPGYFMADTTVQAVGFLIAGKGYIKFVQSLVLKSSLHLKR